MDSAGKKLNKRERYKAILPPFRYYPMIDTLDFNAISEGDSYYLQDYGIFNNPLDEVEFTLRLRITAGRISTPELRALAEIARSHTLQVLLTARAGIQLHGLNSKNVLSVFKRINALGISTWQTFGDNVRNIVTDVYDGVGRHCMIETYPLIRKMEEYFLKNPRLVGLLPRRLSTGISGNSANVSSFFANDLCFVLARKGDVFGFNVHMGGKNTEVARDADIFLPPDELISFFIAFVETFNKHGLRFTRSRTRLHHLLEEIGLDTFKELLSLEYPQGWQGAGEPIREKAPFATYEHLRNGLYGFCYETDFGRVDAEELIRIAAFAETQHAEVRLGVDQNIYLLGLSEPSTPFGNLPQSATVIACAGSHYCPYSFWNIKDDAPFLPLQKIREHRIQIGLSGCAKGCGRHQHSDIGLIGLRTNGFGDADKGARIYIGAEHTAGKSVGRELFDMVPLEHISSVVELIIDEYLLSAHETFETFCASELNRFSTRFLSLWFLATLENGRKAPLHTLYIPASADEADPFDAEKELLEYAFGDAPFLVLVDDHFDDAIRHLAKKLWTVGKTGDTIAPQIRKLLVGKKYWEQ